MSVDLGLDGKVAIVTGGSLGIGRAVAASLVAAGAKVAICGRRADLLQQAAGEIGPHSVLPVVADVSRPPDLERLFAETLGRFGRLDILVNNAGGSMRDAFERVTDEQWQADFDLKLFAAVRACRLAIPHMRRQGSGRIVNVTNFLSKQPSAASAPTSVTRAAGLALTKALSKEYAPENILVNTVCMGFVRAAQHERKAQNRGITPDEYYDELARQVPMGRVGHTEEAANVILFLTSALASYVTGTSINVDGGICAVI